jgi:ADP-ribose pyrophosphatase YjhB (NUDIX family)
MKIAATGLVVNQFGEALLVRRQDTGSWALPGGVVEEGELPTGAAQREIEEETGLKVLPVRLVGLFFWPTWTGGYLSFSFRCLVRGGSLGPSPETPEVAYCPANAWPSPMLPIHWERLERAWRHSGGPPDLIRQSVPWRKRLVMWRVAAHLAGKVRRRAGSEEPPTRPWRVTAFTIIRDQAGAVLWVRRAEHDVWNLPGGGPAKMEPPWETAVRETREETGLNVRLLNLSGVYVEPLANEMALTFAATVVSGALRPSPESAEFAYFAAGQEPTNSLPEHIERVADAISCERTAFRVQDSLPDPRPLGRVAN